MTRELAMDKGRETIQITTENYMEVMELIYPHPNDFVGKKVTYTGFVLTMTHRPRVISSSSVSVLSTVSPIQVFTDWRREEVTKPSRIIPG